MMIKAFTVYQPWATLIMIGAKPFEFRKWNYLERGGVKPGDLIGIHASKRPVRLREVEDLLARLDDRSMTTGLIPDKARPLLALLKACRCKPAEQVMEHSALLGTVRIGAPKLSEEIFPDWKVADSDRLEHCKWAWPMNDPKPIFPPSPMRGLQGFFNASAELVA